jgi:hypothetical protein
MCCYWVDGREIEELVIVAVVLLMIILRDDDDVGVDVEGEMCRRRYQDQLSR